MSTAPQAGNDARTSPEPPDLTARVAELETVVAQLTARVAKLEAQQSHLTRRSVPGEDLPEPAAPRSILLDRFGWIATWAAGLAATGLFLWPLWKHISSNIVERLFSHDALCNIDDMIDLHRSFGHRRHGQSFYDWLYAGHQFFPQPRSLIASELMPLTALATWPLAAWPVLGHNLVMALVITLNVIAGASVARALGAERLAATTAGVAFAMCSIAQCMASRVQLLSIFPMAFAIAAIIRWASAGKARYAILAALWALAQPMTCLYYAYFLALVLPVVIVAARMSHRRPGLIRDFAVMGASMAAAAAVGVALFWPYKDLSALGMTHTYDDVVSQSGDFSAFVTADVTTLMGRVIPDRFTWETACFPGVVVSLALLAGLFRWFKRVPDKRVLWIVPLAILPSAFGGWIATDLLALGGVLWLVVSANRGRLRPAIPIIAASFWISLNIFVGPEPKFFDRPMGWGLYHWLYDHAPSVGGVRMLRRADFVVELMLCAIAALVLTRIERRPRGRWIVAGCLVVALVEGVPWTLTTRKVATNCTDGAMRTAAAEGVSVVGTATATPLKFGGLSDERHMATLCGVSNPIGYGAFVPVASEVLVDDVAMLPDPTAHVALWSAGIRNLVLHDANNAEQKELLQKLAPLVGRIESFGTDRLLTLQEPNRQAETLPRHIEGHRAHVSSITCAQTTPAAPPSATGKPAASTSTFANDCAKAIDGKDDTRWTSSTYPAGGETLTLAFPETVVTGIEWHAPGYGTDLPRGFDIERLGPDGAWLPWRSVAAVDLGGLAQETSTTSIAVSLPPERTKSLRVICHGKSGEYWLSAAEIEVIAASGVGTHVTASAPRLPAGTGIHAPSGLWRMSRAGAGHVGSDN